MQVQQSQSWLGAAAGAVRTFMQLLVALFSVADKAIVMADAAVTSWVEHQAVDLELGDADYSTRAIALASASLVKQREELQQYLAADQSGTRKQAYDACSKQLSEAVEARLAKLRAQRTQA